MHDLERRVIGKVMWRLIPFLILCYFVAYLDRVNVSFAKLHMNQALGFSDAAFGLGAGLFFIAYFLGSSWNRVGKFEGLKGRKARYFRDLFAFLPGSKSGTNARWQGYRNVFGGFGIRIHLRAFARSR